MMPDYSNVEGIQRKTLLFVVKSVQVLTYPLAILHE